MLLIVLNDNFIELACSFLIFCAFYLQGGVLIHEIYKNGAAEKDGRLQPGFRLISVNGVELKEKTHQEALRILRTTSDKVIFIQL